MEAIVDRTVPAIAEGHVQRTVALIAAKVVPAHVDRQLEDVYTASDQSALGVDLTSLMESVLKRKVRTLAVLGAALGNHRILTADRSIQTLPASIEPTLRGQVDKRSHKQDTPIYQPPTLSDARSPHGGANEEDLQSKYDQRENAYENRYGREIRAKRRMIPVKPDTGSDENGNAGIDKRRKKKVRGRKDVKKEPQKPSGRHVEL